MSLRLSFNFLGMRVSIPLGKGRPRFYGNTAHKAGKTLNPRLSMSRRGSGVSVPLQPKKRRGLSWWF